MLNLALAFRYVLLLASVGAGLAALLLLWEGCAKLLRAVSVLAATGDEAATVIGSVMGAIDTFLFAMVLVIFAYAIAFGFVIDLSAEERERLPRWMRICMSELKHTLVAVIVVYLVVDFATDVAQASASLTWDTLVRPISIVLIAGALWLLSLAQREQVGAPTD
jgi:uncharacterized membrane protein YqhA